MANFIALLPSGRGIRFRRLKPSETDRIAINAAKSVDKEATGTEQRIAMAREGVRMFLTAATRKKSFKDPADLIAEGVEWDELSPGKFLDDTVDYDALFTPKDDAIICQIYSHEHEVTVKEVADIMGKVLPVSED